MPNQQQCRKCVRLEAKIAELEPKLAAAVGRVAALESELAKAKKNSSNSSKPPSSDIVNPPKKPEGNRDKKRKRGGQKGHPRHERPAFSPDEIDVTWIHYYTGCPCCGGTMQETEETVKVLQQVELEKLPFRVEEHQRRSQGCTQCGKVHLVPWPEDLKRAGLVGPRLTALIAYLKSSCHCSFSTIRKFLRDVVGVTISRGQLRKLCGKVSDSVETAYQQLLDILPEQDRVNVDETGHKDNGDRLWTWCFRAALFTLFKIDPSRSSKVLLEVLGEEFDGVLGCDYFGAYRKYMRLNEHVVLQFCLAHLIRDIKFLVTHPDRRNKAYGNRVLKAVREMFELFHRRDKMDARQFELKCEDAANELLAAAKFTAPRTAEAQNLANRFWEHGENYVRFLTTPGIEPTNNIAEQAIRFVVIDRHVTQGSRSDSGQRWLERIWTAIATCTQQGKSVFEFLCESIVAHFQGDTPPSLLPDTS